MTDDSEQQPIDRSDSGPAPRSGATESPVPASDPASSDAIESAHLESTQRAAVNEGPGWLPAIMAGTLLLGMTSFVCCGFSTWILFQKRGELAVRTLRGSYLPSLEQSLLDPRDKNAVVRRVDQFASDLERGQYDNDQASGVMQRLQRLPVLQWGELAAVERFVEKLGGEEMENSLDQFSRLRQSVELNQATSFDFERVLKPIFVADNQSPGGRRIIEPLTAEAVREVVQRAKTMADRSSVPNERFEVSIDALVRREIEAGVRDGAY